jgi:predicted peptidase
MFAVTVQTQQSITLQKKREVTARFLLYLPEGYQDKRESKWPLMLFLHGAGERGDNLNRVKVHGPPKMVEQGQEFPFIIVSPQCPKNQRWDDAMLTVLLDHICKEYRVDTSRLYLTGLSMGGYGSWSLGMALCDRLAAIAPICGGGSFIDVYNASGAKGKALRSLGVWAFHGAKDTVVPISESEKMVEALRKFGHPAPKLTIYPDARHDSWTKTYDNPELYQWFLKYQRK